MDARAVSTLKTRTWLEESYFDIADQPSVRRASATQLFQGDIEGESRLEVLLTYHTDGSASTVGLERVVGRVGGRCGSFVLEHSGCVEDGVTKSNFSVVPGSGTGGLHGLRGRGWAVGPRGRGGALTLEYEFEQ